MAQWKLIIFSGSDASLNTLFVSSNITNRGSVAGSHITGSFTGSFKGDGSQLTGLTVSAVSSYTNPGNDRIITSVDASTINGEANLTFNGSLLSVTGRADVSGPITGSNLKLDGTLADGAGETTVLVLAANGDVRSDEIDSRVWGTSLIDGAAIAGYATYYKDTDTITGSREFKFDGSNLRVTGSFKVLGAITGSNIRLNSLATGVDNTVLVVTTTGQVVTDEIDSRVWGTSLVDVTGTPSNNQLATFTDADTVTGETNLTFDGSVLGVTGRINASGAITGSTAKLTGTLADGAGEATVLVLATNGDIRSDEIDTRVWGTSLVDATNGVDNRIATFTDANSLNGEANLTFDGSVLGVTGRINSSGAVTGSNIKLTGTLADGAGEATVLVLDTNGNIRSDEIDTRVWGTSLVDGTGASTRVAYWTDTDSLTSNASFTYNGTVLGVGSSTFGTNVSIAGNLVVAGTASFQHTNTLLVADKFILLNSGSNTGDGGIIIQSGSNGRGVAFGWDASAFRFGYQLDRQMNATGSVMATDGYASVVLDVDGGMTEKVIHRKVGNIKIEGAAAYIYV